jgi:GT2 family glycosyltransferase
LQPPINVVIPTYNSGHCVAACIEGVAGALGACQVIVADNDSADGTATVAGARSVPDCSVEVVQLGRNAGFGAAANAGVGASAGELIIVLNPDVRLVAPVGLDIAAVAAGATGLRAIELRVSVAGGKELHRERPWWWECGRHVLMPFWPREISTRGTELPVGPVWVGGAALILRKSEFERLGGFDERFFMYSEDRDLSRRYRAAGLPVGVTTLLGGTHEHGKSSEGSSGVAPARIAYSLLGWVEYVALTAGHGAGRHAAESRIRGTNAIAAALAAFARLRPSSRLDAKVEQIGALGDYLGQWSRGSLPATDPLSDESYYPLAREALRALTRHHPDALCR